MTITMIKIRKHSKFKECIPSPKFSLEFSGAGFSTNVIITHINKPSLCHTRMVPTICEYTKHPSQLSLAHLCGQAQSVLEISLTTA